jgi:hypothetical protein
MNECTSVDGHFDNHGGAMVQYRVHRLMEEVQGFCKSHKTPSLGYYLLSIAPTAARATENKTTMQYVSTVLTIMMAVALCRYYIARIARWGRSMAFIKAINAAIGRALAPIL